MGSLAPRGLESGPALETTSFMAGPGLAAILAVWGGAGVRPAISAWSRTLRQRLIVPSPVSNAAFAIMFNALSNLYSFDTFTLLLFLWQ
jgi:hypothetical protein